jgi:hypothetical protein
LKKTLETSRAKWKFVFIHQLVGGLDSNARSDQTNNAKDASRGYVTGDGLGGPGHLRVTVSSSQVKIDYVRTYLSQDETARRKNGKADYVYTLTAR